MSKLMNRKTYSVVSVLLLAILCTATAGKVIYVDDDVIVFVSTGSSWALAYNHLQDALADANSSEGPVEIRVAQGVYKPDEGIGIETGDRDASFGLVSGVILKGGYAGFGEPNADARDTVLYETILSGDLDGNDIEVSDPWDLLDEPTRSENSYTVVTVAYDDCFLDGFTICGSNANEPIELPDDPSEGIVIERVKRKKGGGMFINPSSVTITDCTFINNAAGCGGGGIYSKFGEGPILDNCIFIHNSGGSIIKDGTETLTFNAGGGMENHSNNPTLTNCMFIENSATRGAGMYNLSSSPVLTNCTFRRNHALKAAGGMRNLVCNATLIKCVFEANTAGERGEGGGMENRQSNLILNNCIFCGNSALYGGGGIYDYGGSNTILTNCTFAQNSGQRGNALKGPSRTPSNIEFNNCILWDGGEEIWYEDNSSTITITYSDVHGRWSGEGGHNINADPLFASPGYWVDANDPNIIVEPSDPNAVWISGDYHLKSQAGRWEPISESWIVDDVTSPCIDAGDPNNPVGDEPEPNGGIINIGAYGGTNEASKPYAEE